MKKLLLFTFCLLMFGIGSNYAQRGKSKGKGKHQHHDRKDKGRDRDEHEHTNDESAPPGWVKGPNGQMMPPGIAKRMRDGKPLPPGLAKKYGAYEKDEEDDIDEKTVKENEIKTVRKVEEKNAEPTVKKKSSTGIIINDKPVIRKEEGAVIISDPGILKKKESTSPMEDKPVSTDPVKKESGTTAPVKESTQGTASPPKKREGNSDNSGTTAPNPNQKKKEGE